MNGINPKLVIIVLVLVGVVAVAWIYTNVLSPAAPKVSGVIRDVASDAGNAEVINALQNYPGMDTILSSTTMGYTNVSYQVKYTPGYTSGSTLPYATCVMTLVDKTGSSDVIQLHLFKEGDTYRIGDSVLWNGRGITFEELKRLHL